LALRPGGDDGPNASKPTPAKAQKSQPEQARQRTGQPARGNNK